MTNDFDIRDGQLKKYLGNDSEVIVPDGIYKIAAGAFRKKNVVKVTLPKGLTDIGEDAFLSCRELTTVNIPEGVLEIGFQAFRDCIKLSNVKLPGSIELVGTYAFLGCKSITEITIPGTNCSICEDAFRSSGLKKITILEGKKDVANRLCYNCLDLEEVSLPQTIETIGNGAFANCVKLKEIKLPDSIVSIGESAFYMCENLGNTKMPASLNFVGNLAFGGTAITEVTVPEGLTKLGKCIFGIKLKKITLPDTITYIDLDTFTACRELEEINFSKAQEFMYAMLETPFSRKFNH